MTISSGIINVEEVFPGLRQAIEQIPNVAAIQEQLYHQGTFNIVPDSSGAARFYTVMMQAPVFQESLVLKPGLEGASGMALLDPDNYETKIVAQYFTYPSIALEMIRAANGYDVVEPGYQDETRGLFLRRDKGFVYQEQQVEYTKEAFSNLLPQEIFIPVDFKGDMPIDFLGYGGAWQPEFAYEPEYYFNYVSLSDALNKRFPEGTFKDKYVLIGSTDPTLSDLVGSPFRAAFPGLEVHAVVLDNLIQGRFLTDHGKWATLYQFLGILVIGTLIALAISYFESWAAGLGALIVLVGVPTLSYYGLAYDGIIINFVYPWLATVLLTGTIVIINFFVEGRDRRFVTTQFSKMVSGDVLKKLKDDPAGVSLKGQRSSVTVMFSDIAGFTSIAETMPPQDLVQVLNDYFTPMTDIIMKHDGFIDKFMGDAIMSCWGVPFPDDNHALKACMATLEQQKALQELAPRIKERYGIDISVRMGMASGEVSAAMMGSENRKSYTVMGDVVNFGSRLEPCCKDYKVPILIDEETKTQVADAVVTRCVDKIVVKGKTIPVPIYQLVGLKGEVAEADLERLRRFEEALHLHWERQWDAAEAILNDYPKDGPSQTLLKRIAQYRLEPPPPKWQGEFVKTSKK
ncbi:MAG: adenylate/guanylate cyclase domain-containing protein, partial [Chlamydiia bacterium]|nr:adenylate/guanylate cyclase domain-containing protein [Chlamydiia bacterium]